jgi:hypothetical protein
MKKYIILLIWGLLAIGILSGVDQDTLKKFGKTQVYKEKQVQVIKFEAMKPNIERYQKKTDTDLTKGFYQLYKNKLRETNKVILNKWLKEFK